MSYTIEVKPASKNSWFTPAESNAYYSARYSREGITLHWWGGGEKADRHDGIVSYFLQQGVAGVKSVNYVVSDIKITEMVSPDNVAWCSQGGNPTTISIECQPTLGEEGYKRLGWLIKYLETRYGHKMSLYPHSKWYATSCPGSISITKARQYADGSTATTPVKPAPVPPPATAPAVTPSNGRAQAIRESNVRVNPTTKAAIGGSKLLKPGETFVYVAKVKGEKVSQNGVTTDVWFKSQYGNYVWAGNLKDLGNGGVPVSAPPAPQAGTATVVSSANVRSAPTTSAPLAGSMTLKPGETFQYVAKVKGESVNGNNIWYQSWRNNYVWSGNVRG